jgi:hypothetical protein
MNYMKTTNYNLLLPLRKFQTAILGSRSPDGASLEWLRRMCRARQLRAVKVSSDWFTTSVWVDEFNRARIGEPSARTKSTK